MFYKRRKRDSKILAYEALIKYQVHSLPVMLSDDKFKNIRFFSLQYMAEYFNEPIDQILSEARYRGFIFYQAEFDRYVVFLNSDDPEPLLRWSVAMAIGYIESKSQKSHEACFFNSPGKYIEDFTYTFTCPDCVLEMHNIISFNDIVKFCRIPFPNALEKSKRLSLSPRLEGSTEVKLCEILNKLITIRKT